MKRFVVLLVALAALVGLATLWVPSPAATIDGRSISRQSLNADLAAVAGDAAYQCYLQATLELAGGNAAGLFPVTGAGSSTGGNTPTYNTNFVSYWLGQLEADVLVSRALAARHLTVTASDLAVGRATLDAQVTTVLGDVDHQTGSTCAASATALLDTLPTSFVAEQVRGAAERDMLEADEAGYSLSTPSVTRFFAAHKAEFDKECISYVGFASKTAAAAALASIEAGTPITQTGTLTQIGCGLEVKITDLPASAVDAAVGKVSQPVAEGTQYVLLVVTSRTPTPLASVTATVREALITSGLRRTQTWFEGAIRRAQVTVDPRYGQVTPTSAVIGLPPSPADAFVLNPRAALPPALRPQAPSKPAKKKSSSTSPASG